VQDYVVDYRPRHDPLERRQCHDYGATDGSQCRWPGSHAVHARLCQMQGRQLASSIEYAVPRSSAACRRDSLITSNRASLRLHSSLAALIVGPTLGSVGDAQERHFKTGTSLVEFDVVVRDSNRQPVRGLTTADFTIFEDD